MMTWGFRAPGLLWSSAPTLSTGKRSRPRCCRQKLHACQKSRMRHKLLSRSMFASRHSEERKRLVQICDLLFCQRSQQHATTGCGVCVLPESGGAGHFRPAPGPGRWPCQRRQRQKLTADSDCDHRRQRHGPPPTATETHRRQ